jgi:hypothetical protein
MVSQHFFCPLGCLHKFVIFFAAQFVFARLATMPEKQLSLAETILHLRLATFVPTLCITTGKCYPGKMLHSGHFTCLIQQPCLIAPCSGLSGTLLTVSFHSPATNVYVRAGGHRLRLGLSSQILAYTSGILNDSPALCVHIPCSHYPVRPSRWHSPPRPFVPLSRGLLARSTLQC